MIAAALAVIAQAPSHDWTLLAEGWTFDEIGFLWQANSPYRYWVGSGEVDAELGESATEAPQRAFEFHGDARAQADRCRVDWMAEAQRIARQLMCVVVEVEQTLDIKSSRKAILAIRCWYDENRKEASWVINPAPQQSTLYVTNSLTQLRTVEAALLELGWRFA